MCWARGANLFRPCTASAHRSSVPPRAKMSLGRRDRTSLRASSEETFSEAEAAGLDSLGFLENRRGEVRPHRELPPHREGSDRSGGSSPKGGVSRGSRWTRASAMETPAGHSHRPRVARRTSPRGQGRAAGFRDRSVRKPRRRPGQRRFQTRASRARRGQARCVEDRIAPSAGRRRTGSHLRWIECVARRLGKE